MHLMGIVESTFIVRWHMFPQRDKDGEELDLHTLVEGTGEMVKVLMENMITVGIGHSYSCYPGCPVPCQLKIVDCDPRIIEYQNEGMEGRGWELVENEIFNDGVGDSDGW
jgi:hypothetical protein